MVEGADLRMRESTEIAVIGAGIAGLATAVALQRVGVPVRVYEQARALGEVGAGVALSRNSVAFFEDHGLGEPFHELGSTVERGMVTYRADGSLIHAPGYSGGRSQHRADLIEILRRGLRPGTVELGAKLLSIDQDEDGVTLVFADGGRRRALAAIGADGIHSASRAAVVEAGPPTFSGMMAYRGLVPADRLSGWPLDEARLFIGRDRHFLVFPVRRSTLLNFVGFVPADEEVRESWSAEGDVSALAVEFAAWGPEVRDFIARIEHTWRWGLYDREPLDAWADGRVALVGDAAHAMLPHAAQGANQSFEDALALATLLEGRPLEQLRSALREYDLARRARGSYVQLYARRLGLIWDGHDAQLAGRTDLAERADVDRWIHGHDVRATARRARETGERVDLPNGAPV